MIKIQKQKNKSRPTIRGPLQVKKEVPALWVHPRCANAHNCLGLTLGTVLSTGLLYQNLEVSK